MSSSIELWLHFALHALRALFCLRFPSEIAPGDVLARELYSGHITRGQANASAFKPAPANGFGVSVSRWNLAPPRLFMALGHESARVRAARNRSNVSFKGFAHFTADALRAAGTAEIRMEAVSAITKKNPLHANIQFPSDRGPDYYLEVQTLILEKVQPITCLTQ